MDQQKVREILSGRRRGARAALLRAALSVAAAPYSLFMRARRRLYRRGWKRSHAAPVPVVCVGNLTTGGTGKTPMVAYVVRALRKMGRTPAVLTRGYKAVDGASDEAELLRRETGAEVIVGADRVASSQQARDGGCDVCVMDDGFQHLRMRRDQDIVLIDAGEPFGYGRCLPRGLLREPTSALRDADAVVLTRSDAVDPDKLDALKTRVAELAPHAVLATAAHRPTHLRDEHGNERPLEDLAGRMVVAFTGIGRPSAFFETLRRLHARLCVELPLDDHVEYTPEVVQRVAEALTSCEGQLLVTTQKDRVKLEGAELPAPLWTLSIEMEVMEGEGELLAAIERAVESRGEALVESGRGGR